MKEYQRTTKYWLNPIYKFREEYWGLQAYHLIKPTYQITDDAVKVLQECDGKTLKEIVQQTGFEKSYVGELLNFVKTKELVIQSKPKRINKIITRCFKRPYCKSSPDGIFLEITHRCNLNCIHCYTNSGVSNIDRTKELSTQQIKQLINDASRIGVFIFSIGGGEPFMRKDIYDILKFGYQKNIEMIPVTNGHFINKNSILNLKNSGVGQIIVSLDGSRSETHNRIRRADSYAIVIKSIKLLVESDFRVFVNYVVNKINLSEVEDVIKLVKKLGISLFRAIRLTPFGRSQKHKDELSLSVDEYFKFVKLLNILSPIYNDKNFRIEKDEAFLGLLDPTFNLKRMPWLPDKYRGCPAARSFIFIDPCGDVYPCGYLNLPEFKIGNLKEKSIVEIWEDDNNKILKIFRRMKKLNNYCESCPNLRSCQGGCRALAYLKHFNLYSPDPLCIRRLSKVQDLD